MGPGTDRELLDCGKEEVRCTDHHRPNYRFALIEQGGRGAWKGTIASLPTKRTFSVHVILYKWRFSKRTPFCKGC